MAANSPGGLWKQSPPSLSILAETADLSTLVEAAEAGLAIRGLILIEKNKLTKFTNLFD